MEGRAHVWRHRTHLLRAARSDLDWRRPSAHRRESAMATSEATGPALGRFRAVLDRPSGRNARPPRRSACMAIPRNRARGNRRISRICEPDGPPQRPGGHDLPQRRRRRSRRDPLQALLRRVGDGPLTAAVDRGACLPAAGGVPGKDHRGLRRQPVGFADAGSAPRPGQHRQRRELGGRVFAFRNRDVRRRQQRAAPRRIARRHQALSLQLLCLEPSAVPLHNRSGTGHVDQSGPRGRRLDAGCFR